MLALPIPFVDAALQFTALVLVPELAFMFVLLILLICMTSMPCLPVRPALCAWGGLAVALGLVTNSSGRAFDVPARRCPRSGSPGPLSC